jgi:hypothetical protein
MTRTNRRASPRRALEIEGLESRDLMSGQIFIEFTFHAGARSQEYPVAAFQFGSNGIESGNNNFTITTTAGAPPNLSLFESLSLIESEPGASVTVTFDGSNGQLLLLETFSLVHVEGIGPDYSNPNAQYPPELVTFGYISASAFAPKWS